MSDHLHEPGEDGDVIDQAQLDMAEGVSPAARPASGRSSPTPPRPGTPGRRPRSAPPVRSAAEGATRPAGPTSATTGTAGGTGAGRDEAAAPPSAPG
jgi:hypothetical protein